MVFLFWFLIDHRRQHRPRYRCALVPAYRGKKGESDKAGVDRALSHRRTALHCCPNRRSPLGRPSHWSTPQDESSAPARAQTAENRRSAINSFSLTTRFSMVAPVPGLTSGPVSKCVASSFALVSCTTLGQLSVTEANDKLVATRPFTHKCCRRQHL